jgi:hypothetical protein
MNFWAGGGQATFAHTTSRRLGGQADSKGDIVDDHQDLVGKLKAEF